MHFDRAHTAFNLLAISCRPRCPAANVASSRTLIEIFRDLYWRKAEPFKRKRMETVMTVARDKVGGKGKTGKQPD